MSIVLIKIATIVIKTVAKPIISWLTHYNKLVLKESTHKEIDIIKNKLNNLGQNYHYYQTKFNRKILKLNTMDPIKLLPEDKAIERGVEFLSEIFLYTIMIGIPIWELSKNSNTKQKEKLIEQKILNRISNGSDAIKVDNKALIDMIDKDINYRLNELNSLI